MNHNSRFNYSVCVCVCVGWLPYMLTQAPIPNPRLLIINALPLGQNSIKSFSVKT